MRPIDILLAALTTTLIACGPSAPPPAGTFDANFGRDARRPPTPDAGRPTPDTGPLGSCVPEYFELAPEQAIAVGSPDVFGADDFLVTWNRDDGVFAAQVERTGTSMVQGRLSEEGADVGSSSVAEGFVVWSQSIDGHLRIVGRTVDGMAPSGPESVISENSRTDQILPAVDRVNGGWLTAWVELNATTTQLKTRVWSDSAGPEQVVAVGVDVEAPSVVGRGDHAIVAWRSGEELHVARVTADASVDMLLETNHAATGAYDLSFHEDGGLIVFESEASDGSGQLYAIRLDTAGVPRGAELRISEAGELDARVARVGTFLGGYVVAYRGSPSGSPEPLVRLAFIHGSTGDRIHTLDLGVGEGGPVSVAVADDGTVLATWTTVVATGSQVVGSRVLCGDVWLRCSPR